MNALGRQHFPNRRPPLIWINADGMVLAANWLASPH